ncbi:invasion associated locus B family protein [Actibacterium sp. 188UL27-1]|uniref:invasion associated locus B family protein n=1 Tax=Actibacterium sp. 188UL27-1 TaxID=2786961 RepID=UPI001959758E|nr:invasion associated locus B family protein [Actibacterium sp. 188UL27-1]MBM7067422.1 invasion associated locus B family protein [Actibacterium sp. 188UL27-1]
MQTYWKTTIAALVLTAGTALAQDTATPEAGAATDQPPSRPIEGLQLGEDVNTGDSDAQAPETGPGSVYQKEISGDWEVRCVRVEEGQIEPCNLYQLLKDESGNNVAEITMFALPPGNEAAAGAQIITPLETLLTRQITLRVDGGSAKRYQFSFCTRIGCFAQVGFTPQDVASFRAGNKATLTIVPVGAPDDVTVDLGVSLSGFTAGFKSIQDTANSIAAARETQN